MLVTVTFQDHGQDFLEWDIDTEKEQIVGCRPFQASIWCGNTCKQKAFEVGGQVCYEARALDGQLRWVNYRIEAIKIHEPKPPKQPRRRRPIAAPSANIQ